MAKVECGDFGRPHLVFPALDAGRTKNPLPFIMRSEVRFSYRVAVWA